MAAKRSSNEHTLTRRRGTVVSHLKFVIIPDNDPADVQRTRTQTNMHTLRCAVASSEGGGTNNFTPGANFVAVSPRLPSSSGLRCTTEEEVWAEWPSARVRVHGYAHGYCDVIFRPETPLTACLASFTAK